MAATADEFEVPSPPALRDTTDAAGIPALVDAGFPASSPTSPREESSRRVHRSSATAP